MKRTIIAIALAGIMLSVLFPPWVRTQTRVHARNSAGYSLIFSPPLPEDGFYSIEIDYGKLGLEWVFLAAALGSAVLVSGMLSQKRRSAPEATTTGYRRSGDVRFVLAAIFIAILITLCALLA